MRRFKTSAASLMIAALVAPVMVHAQQLGYKLLGGAGIDAGVQSPPGLYLINQSLHYGAQELRGRDGHVVPIEGLDIDAFGNLTGAAYTMVRHRTYLTFAFGLPLARVHLSTDNPAASLAGRGFSDLFLQPLKLGWRIRRFDVVTGYMIYAPTGKFEPRGGSVGRGYWTHALTLGGAVFEDSTRTTRASVLASYEINSRNRKVDIRRGNMFHVQGGVGVGVLRVATIGLAGFALFQATGDRGALPPALRGQWSRVFGLGPEFDVTIPKWRMRIEARFQRELGVRSRPEGQVIAGGVSYGIR